jgi:hypothetical protein
MRSFPVMPAKAGIQKRRNWIPAFAGMTIAVWLQPSQWGIE